MTKLISLRSCLAEMGIIAWRISLHLYASWSFAAIKRKTYLLLRRYDISCCIVLAQVAMICFENRPPIHIIDRVVAADLGSLEKR